jgi:hypothetical protein
VGRFYVKGRHVEHIVAGRAAAGVPQTADPLRLPAATVVTGQKETIRHLRLREQRSGVLHLRRRRQPASTHTRVPEMLGTVGRFCLQKSGWRLLANRDSVALARRFAGPGR